MLLRIAFQRRRRFQSRGTLGELGVILRHRTHPFHQCLPSRVGRRQLLQRFQFRAQRQQRQNRFTQRCQLAVRHGHRVELAIEPPHFAGESHRFALGHAQLGQQLLHLVPLRLRIEPLRCHRAQAFRRADASHLGFSGTRSRHGQSGFGIGMPCFRPLISARSARRRSRAISCAPLIRS